MTKTFQVGHTYETTSICDSECWHRITIAKRTAKTITTTDGKTLRPYIWEGVEQVKPNGSYSMCAIIGADDEGREARTKARSEAGRMMAEATRRPVIFRGAANDA